MQALVQLYRWPVILVRVLLQAFHLSDLQESYLCQGQRLSTHFSGIGTVEQGLTYLKAELVKHGLDCKLEPVACTDYDKHSIKVLLRTSHGCVFGNILDRSKLKPHTFRNISSTSKRIKAMLRASIEPKASCHAHKKKCCVPKVDVDMSGSPCTAHSRIGKRLGTLDPNFQVLLTWARNQIKNGTPVLVHENVIGFPFSLIETIWFIPLSDSSLPVVVVRLPCLFIECCFPQFGTFFDSINFCSCTTFFHLA